MAHEWKVKVRVFETDGLGHVSNISYFIYLEEARVECFRQLGSSMEISDWPFILASTTCDYIQQAYFDETLHIKTTVTQIGNSSFELSHEISSERGLIAKAKAVIVHFNFENEKSEKIPHDMRKKLEDMKEDTLEVSNNE
ncbi:acyl-CoA thioesterase [Alteribacillus sp. HJP-4]|uniref:acyl-CoA thioesterase n=1 Tax=Alteribacillus sp. HJP-4 TaxID=2775394 RepID=UPI0035CD0D4A